MSHDSGGTIIAKMISKGIGPITWLVRIIVLAWKRLATFQSTYDITDLRSSIEQRCTKSNN